MSPAFVSGGWISQLCQRFSERVSLKAPPPRWELPKQRGRPSICLASTGSSMDNKITTAKWSDTHPAIEVKNMDEYKNKKNGRPINVGRPFSFGILFLFYFAIAQGGMERAQAIIKAFDDPYGGVENSFGAPYNYAHKLSEL
jgi:hypothetical protein